jgi:chromate transport protein ChrA
MDIDKIILKVTWKTIISSLRDLIVSGLALTLMFGIYVFIFEESPPFFLYIIHLIFYFIYL